MRVDRILLVFIVTFSMIGSLSAQQASVQPGPPICYTVIDLGLALPGAYDLNANGTVVGQTDRWDATLRGFVYERGKVSALQTPVGGTSSAQGVNNRGQIVGAATLPNGLWYPVLWWKGKVIDLGLLGGTWGIAQDINDNGDVVSCIDGRVVAWIRGSSLDLAIPNAYFMWPAGINNQRDIAATEYAPEGGHGWLYRDGAWNRFDSPGSGGTYLHDVNKRGAVCGGGNFANGYHGFIYDNGAWIDFDPTGQWWWGQCTGLNDRGYAVGVFGGPLFSNHAFLRRNAKEGMLDLNSLIPSDSGLTLDTADKINERGQITAFATMQDGTHAILLVPMVCGVHCVPAPNNLIAWWPGDKNTKDIAGGNDGTLQAGAGYRPGAVGMAFSVTAGGYVDVPDTAVLNFTDAMSVVVWVRANSFNDISAVVKKSDFAQTNGYALEMAGSQMAFWVSLNSAGWQNAISITKLAPDTWYQISGTYDGSAIRVYVNGVLETENYVADTIAVSTNNLNIGRDPSNPEDTSRYWDGLIDEVQLFNRALGSSEVLTIYQAGRQGVCKP